MPEYRRNRVPGATYFFTVNLLDRRSDLLVTQIDTLREAVRKVRHRRPFHIDAWVVLPDHMHCLWTLPEADSDFPGRWQAIKVAFSKSLPNQHRRAPVLLRPGERGIWQRRYWEHTVRDDRDHAAHMDYIHFNPVKHGFVERPGDWAFLQLPPLRGCRVLPSRLARRRQRTVRNRRTKVMRDGGMRFAFPPYGSVNLLFTNRGKIGTTYARIAAISSVMMSYG